MKRLFTLDAIRGTAVLAMIAFHLLWDMKYIFGVAMPNYTDSVEAVFGRCIGITFIFVSGFAWGLGKRHVRRGVTILLGGLAVSAVTLVVMPKMPIYFGILTLIGSLTLIMIPLRHLLDRLNPHIAIAPFLVAYVLCINVPQRVFGIFGLTVVLPSSLYANIFSAYFGFPPGNFLSADYYPIIPWIFLYCAGYMLFRIMQGRGWLGALSRVRIPPLEWVGRHSLIIYLLHQPIIYFALYLIYVAL